MFHKTSSIFSQKWKWSLKYSTLILGCSLLLVFICSTITLSFLYPHYEQTALDQVLQPPSKAHPFGTDILGRCMLARTLQGVRISLYVALFATFIDATIGIFWATLALFLEKKLSFVMMRITEILFSIPKLPMIILALVIFNHGFFPLLLAMTVTGWIPIARIIYGQYILIEKKPFILSAKAMGASPFYIFKKHLLPNTLVTVISTLIFTIPGAIYTEAFISFIGLGIQPPQASLGTLVKEGVGAIGYYPWLFFIPSAVMVLLSVSFNLIGEGAKAILAEENIYA